MQKNFLTLPQDNLETEVLNPLRRDKAHALEVADAIAVEYDRIERDRTLSDEGKQKAFATLGNKYVERFAFLGGRITQTADAEARLRTVNYGALDLPTESEVKTLIRELRAGELRTTFNGDNRATAFLQALEQDNLELVHAWLTAPGGPWVSEEIRQRGAEAYAARHTPDAFKKLHLVRTLREHLQALAEQTRQLLVGLGADAVAVAKALNGGPNVAIQ